MDETNDACQSARLALEQRPNKRCLDDISAFLNDEFGYKAKWLADMSLLKQWGKKRAAFVSSCN